MEVSTTLTGLLGTLHVLAAVTWIGSILYHFVAVRPTIKVFGSQPTSGTGERAEANYLTLTAASLVVLALTGLAITSDQWSVLTPVLTQPAGLVLLIKLLLVATLGVLFVFQLSRHYPHIRRIGRPVRGHTNISSFQDDVKNRERFFLYYLAAGILVIVLSLMLSGLLRQAG